VALSATREIYVALGVIVNTFGENGSAEDGLRRILPFGISGLNLLLSARFLRVLLATCDIYKISGRRIRSAERECVTQ
jgi:hypothetical protein